MSRRIEVELTSDRGDGTLTWRAAGAKEPKGVLEAKLLPSGVKVGDTVKAEADYDMEGVTIVAVLPPPAKKAADNVIEFIGAPPPPPRDYSKEPDRRDRKPRRGDRKGRDGRDGRDGGRERRPQGERPERPRFERPEKPKLPPKPKAPRLRAGRTHRQALLAELPEEQRPVAEQVLKGGIPAVRAAIDEQNEAAKAAGNPPVKADALITLAESIVPRARVAEWRDRAEAAIEQIDTVDLRDLRSVVTKAETAAKDEESRELAEKLRTGLAQRLEKEQAAWLAEIAELLADDRVVRALNVSSRPPKAGTPLPPDLAERLATAAGAALTDQIGPKRWSTVLEALALSPVHNKVEPASVPASPNEELVAAVTKVSMQVPQIAARFGIEPKAPPRDRGRRRPRTGGGGGAPARSAEKKAPRIPPPPPLEQTPVAASPEAVQGAAAVVGAESPAPDAAAVTPGEEAEQAPTKVVEEATVEATAVESPASDAAAVPPSDGPRLAPADTVQEAAAAGAAAITPRDEESPAPEPSEAPPAVEEVTGVPVDQVEGADVPEEVAPAEALEATVDPPEDPAMPDVTGVPADTEPPPEAVAPAVDEAPVEEVAVEAAADAGVPPPVVAEEAAAPTDDEPLGT